MKWSIEKANEWYKNIGWVVGFNYVTSTAVNSTEMWQFDTFDIETINKELAVAAEMGFNSCRVFLQFLVWESERNGFLDTFDKFLAIACKHGISVMPILFDDCAFSGNEPFLGKQHDPVTGVTNSRWTPSPGSVIADDPEKIGVLEEYVQSIVKRFGDDSRVLMWDVYNEPGNNGRGEKSILFLQNAFDWVRKCDPVQPVTAGAWDRDKQTAWDTECLALSDVISFHDYESIGRTKEHVAFLREFERPIFCTEWLLRQNNNTFMIHLEFFKKNNISAYNWGLVEGKTQTYLSWVQENNPVEGLPDLWQHDLFYKDLTPYNPNEIDLIKKLTSK